MKRSVISLLLFLCFGFIANAQTYHISKYRWGMPSPSSASHDFDWGRFKKAGFDIAIDTDKNCVVIGGPSDSRTFTLLDEHPTVIEKYNPSYSGRSYCMAADGNNQYEIYIREHAGKAAEIIVYEPNGTFWCYQVDTSR